MSTEAAVLPMTTSSRCHLSRLRLYCFRNYASLDLDISDGINVFVGDNAQGKSNLLEAVATVLLTKSPRASSPAELLQWGSPESAVDLVASEDGADVKISLRLHAGERTAKQHLLDGSPVKPTEILGLYPIVSFWPDELQLVKAGPELRRRWMDQIAVQTSAAYRESRARYRSCLEQRNAALRGYRTGTSDLTAIRSFDPELIRHGSLLICERRRLLAELAASAGEKHLVLSGEREELSLKYLPGIATEESDIAAIENAFRESLQRNAAEEFARGITVAGPHRDDVEIYINDHAARVSASQGQQRSAVLAMKLAEVHYFEGHSARQPIILLDDVLSELDPDRREFLLDALRRSGIEQTLITTTSDMIPSLRANRYRVTVGTVQPE